MINAPVLHVNGDYPEGIVLSAQEALCALNADYPRKDVARAMDIAFRYRHYFRKVRTMKYVSSWNIAERVSLFGQDIIVDLLVYRRW
jgi:probable 2-oxoglutarate dehydrogenase E1 component DHKTD1